MAVSNRDRYPSTVFLELILSDSAGGGNVAIGITQDIAHEAQVSLFALRRAYFSKPRMYGTSGGRDLVLNCGPRVER